MKGIEEKAVYAIWAQVDSKSVDDRETRLDATRPVRHPMAPNLYLFYLTFH